MKRFSQTFLTQAKRSLVKNTTLQLNNNLLYKYKATNVHHISAASIAHSSTGISEKSVEEDVITITFIDTEGGRHRVNARVGENLLEIAGRNQLHRFLKPAPQCHGADDSPMCSLCHVFITEPHLYKVTAPTEQEDFILYQSSTTPNSRLGCQVYVTKEFDGASIAIPPRTLANEYDPSYAFYS